MRTTSPKIELCVSDICLDINKKTILHNVSVTAHSGQLLGIMGPTGSGKTTLLNVISGRQKHDSGTITCNGSPFTKRLRRNLGFVQQQDVFFSQLTLKETLQFTAYLRMPESISAEDKEKAVNDIVDVLDIRKCLDTMIGDIFVKGLSGGEKKRASIASELLVDPDILLLDEPTSGLDSSTAYDIMYCLMKYTTEFNKTIIVTIHQPSSRIYHMFEKLLVLVGGKTGYYGKVSRILPYFEGLDLHCATRYNPADFLLEVMKSDEDTVKRIVDKAEALRYSRHQECNTQGDGGEDTTASFGDTDSLLDDMEETHNKLLGNGTATKVDMLPMDINEEVFGEDVKKWPTSWWTQYRVLAWRSLKQSLGVLKQGYSLAQIIIVSCLSCSLYFQMKLSLETSRDMFGLIFFIAGYVTFNPIFVTLTTYPTERAIINKERASGAYRLSAYYFAKVTSDLPDVFIQPTIMLTIFFWIGGFGGPEHFFPILCLLYVQSFACFGVGLFVSALCLDLRMALTSTFSFLISTFLLGGFFSQNVPSWIAWAKFCSPFHYPYSAAITILMSQVPDTPCNQTSVDQFPSCAVNGTTFVTQEQMLHKANVTLQLHHYVIVIITYCVVIKFTAYLTLRLKKQVPK